MEIEDRDAFMQAMKTDYSLPIILTEGRWVLPAGAFTKTGCGPS